jgi:hypothetical protein
LIGEGNDLLSYRSFGRRAVCGKCGSKRVDVRPNWKEQPPQSSLTGKVWR